MKKAAWAIILLFILWCTAQAGEAPTADTPESGTTVGWQTEGRDPYAGDVKKILEPISLSEDYDQGKLISLELATRHRDPTRAMVQSILVPGWGQFYNGKPAKAALAIAGEGLSGALTIYNYTIMVRYDRQARDAFRLANKYYDGDLKGDGNYQTKLGVDYDNHYKYFTIETEKNLWFLLGTIFLSALDAYVDAHLSDFDIYDLPRDPNAPQDLVIPIWGVSFSW